jgi:hypothetical protein
MIGRMFFWHWHKAHQQMLKDACFWLRRAAAQLINR